MHVYRQACNTVLLFNRCQNLQVGQYLGQLRTVCSDRVLSFKGIDRVQCFLNVWVLSLPSAVFWVPGHDLLLREGEA